MWSWRPDAAVLAVAISTAAPGAAVEIRAHIDGTPIDGEAVVQAGTPFVLDVAVVEAMTGNGLRGLHPLAWFYARHDDEASATCRAPVGRAASAAATLALDGTSFLVAHEDGLLALVDPHVSLATSNVRSTRAMEAPPFAMAVAIDERHGAVVHADRLRVDILDLPNLSVVATHTLDAPATEIVPDPVSIGWWIGDLDGRVSRLALNGSVDVRRRVGDGAAVLASASGGRVVAAAGQQAAILEADGTIARAVDLAWPAADVAVAELADAAVVSTADTAAISVVPLTQGDPVSIDVTTPWSLVVAASDGRFVIGLGAGDGVLDVVDMATRQRRHAFVLDAGGDRLLATDLFVYVRQRTSPHYALLDVTALREGRTPALFQLTAGSEPSPPSQGVAPIARLPFTGVAFVHTSDRTLSFYHEGGMQAPATATRLRTGRPVGLATVDRSLREVPGGSYRATVALTSGGPHRLVVRSADPQVTRCFDLSVIGHEPVDLSSPRRIRWIAPHADSRRGAIVELAFEVDGSPAADAIPVLLTAVGGHWQRVVLAERDGPRYRLRTATPSAGSFLAVVYDDVRWQDAEGLMFEVQP